MATYPTARELYSDFFNSFVENPVSLDLARKTNEEAVKQSIKNLILTNKGERLFQPNIGASIRKLLFENMNQQTYTIIKQNITNTLELYEPRCELLDVIVVPREEQHSINIRIVFRTINTIEPTTLDLILGRVR